MDLTKQKMGVSWRRLAGPWKFLPVVLVVKLLQVSQKQRGLQVKWPGSISVARWAHMFNKNHLMEPWHGTMNPRMTERFELNGVLKVSNP